MMKTYLLVWFSSDGTRPSEVNRALMSLGFQPMQGSYDYVYDWDDNVDVNEILEFGDKVHLSLEGMGVMFKIETIENRT
ncbi:conserved hypothetical protein [Methanosalsum zhilinae DSM 4017]|uniref:Uncharacterized protein n=2 Tax=Methanosalsum zhilinae TaxID=39669 RepID=F7XM08_METZD|nr:conserved hypothetical protein [Methanosalsum zhilinae DSM 4017]